MPQVQRKQDFIAVDCKQLKIKMEEFTANLEDFQQYIEDVAQENIRLRVIVGKLDAIAAKPIPLAVDAMRRFIQDRQDALRLPAG
jgi:hypothetical protein